MIDTETSEERRINDDRLAQATHRNPTDPQVTGSLHFDILPNIVTHWSV